MRRGFLVRADRGGGVAGVGAERGGGGRRRRPPDRVVLLAEASTDLDSGGGEEKRGQERGLGMEFSTKPEVVGSGLRSPWRAGGGGGGGWR